MRLHNFPLSLGAALLLGCAQAGVTTPAAMRAQAIADMEPDVTRQVLDVLERLADGNVLRERFTERASTALDEAAAGALTAQLRPCPRPLVLVLLERSTKGEDRQYLYRAACGQQGLLVEIVFNKAARINKLAVHADKGA
jgi:hypothetical protein